MMKNKINKTIPSDVTIKNENTYLTLGMHFLEKN